MVEMSEGTTGSVSWKRTLAKISIVLVFPISIWMEPGFGIGLWISILFHMEPSRSLIFASPITVLIAIFLMLPGVYFDRKIHSNPISSSIRRKAIILVVATWLLSYGFAFLSFFDPYFFSVVLFTRIVYIQTLTISIFIFLPILNRELTIRSTPANMQTYSLSYLSNVFQSRFGKLRFLPVLIWAGFLFSPIVSLGSWGNILLLSIFYQMQLFLGVGLIREIIFSYAFFLNLTPIYLLHYVMLVFSLRFVFVRDIYRYSDGRVTKSRLISTGLLAEIVPVAVLSLLSLSMYGFYEFILPTPFFPLLGYLYVRFSKIPLMIDELWEDDEHRMWYERDKPHLSPLQPPTEQGIKVPISYLIVSQFRRLRKQ